MTAARVYENDLGNVDDADRALPQGARDRPAQSRAPPSRSSASSGRPSGTPSSRIILQRKSEILEEPGDEEGRALPGRRHRGGRPQPAGGGHRRLQQGPRDRRRRRARHRRADPAVPRPRALAGSARPCTRRRPISSPTSTRRRASTTRSAPSSSASSATCRAPSTPTRRSSSSIRTTCRRSRASTSSTSRRRTGPSSSPC